MAWVQPFANNDHKNIYKTFIRILQTQHYKKDNKTLSDRKSRIHPLNTQKQSYMKPPPPDTPAPFLVIKKTRVPQSKKHDSNLKSKTTYLNTEPELKILQVNQPTLPNPQPPSPPHTPTSRSVVLELEKGKPTDRKSSTEVITGISTEIDEITLGITLENTPRHPNIPSWSLHHLHPSSATTPAAAQAALVAATQQKGQTYRRNYIRQSHFHPVVNLIRPRLRRKYFIRPT